MTKPMTKEQQFKADEQKRNESEVATKLLVLEADENLYLNIAKLEKQKGEVKAWLDKYEHTEDEKIAASIFVSKNKFSRLSRELDTLLNKRTALEIEASEFNFKYQEAIVAKKAVTAMTNILDNLNSIPTDYEWYLSTLPLLRGEAETEKHRNEVLLKEFKKLVSVSSNFNVKL